ncbi:MAG: DUF748 domain-containing protein [Nitrospiraceae bacterium]
MEGDTPGVETSQRRLSKRTTLTLWLGALLALYAGIGFFIAPILIKSRLESTLPEQLGHPVTVKEVRLNPFALSLTVRGFEISDHDRSALIGFDELYVNLELASIINRAVTFDAIRLQLPYAVVRIKEDGTLNLLDLRPTPGGATPAAESAQSALPKQEDQKLPAVIVKVLQFDRGVLEFHDDSKSTPFSADIVPITFTLLNFSTEPDSPDSLSFAAEIDPGEKLEWRGTLYFQPLRSEGTVILTGLKARTLWEYIQDLVRFEITDGAIDLKADYEVGAGSDTLQASVKTGEFKLTKFALGEKGGKESLVTIPAFSIEGIKADLPSRQVQIASVRSSDARISGWLGKDGRVNYQTLFAGEASQAAMPEEPRPGASADSSKKPWTVRIKEVSIENYGISFEDRRPATPVRLFLEPLRVKLTNVTSQLDSKVDLDLFVRINDTGTIATTGTIAMQPLSMDLALDVSKIALGPFQPYVDPIAELTLNSGAANLKGHLSYGSPKRAGPLMHFDGMVSIVKLAAQDRLLNKDFLRWDALSVNGLKLNVMPTSVAVSTIVVKKPYVRLIIGPDRTTNLQAILVKPDSADGTAAAQPPPTDAKRKAGEAAPVRIGAVQIVDGSAHFADFSLMPVVETGIYRMNGTIKGLSSKELSRADVSIESQVDNYAPVRVEGKINPLTSDAFTDITVSFKNVELTTVSPYSNKFAGYPIHKGKVSIDLMYKLSKNLLEAENKVVIDQLTLGEKVEGPDATSLPVKLAIALLKDRNGVIDIDLPVRGDLNDPDFQYGRLLLNVFMNLITKAVTSPFNLIAGLVGASGEELSGVQFPLGSASLPPASETKLKTLAKALADRPGLRLEVAGAADPGADATALAETKLHRELVKLKLEELQAAGKPAPAGADTILLTDTEQAALVRALYVKKFGRLPEPSAQKDSKAPEAPTVQIATLKGQLLGEMKVDESEIRLLAQERAKRIQDFLVTQVGIVPERVFLLDVKVDAKEAGGSVAVKLGLNAS